MKVRPSGPLGCVFKLPPDAGGVPRLWGYLTKELTVLGKTSFHNESYFVVLHEGSPHFVYESGWGVVPGTEEPLVRETALDRARRLWPKSKPALREALSFAQFLDEKPQSQPGNAKLIPTLEALLDRQGGKACYYRGLVEGHLDRGLNKFLTRS